jgi:hypothetical protein
MRTFKRDNWTNEQIHKFLIGEIPDEMAEQ